MNLAFAGRVSFWVGEQEPDHCHHREGKVHLVLATRLFAWSVIDPSYAPRNCRYVVDCRHSHLQGTPAGYHERFPSEILRHPIAKHRYPEMIVADPGPSSVVLFGIHQKLPATTDQAVVVPVLEKETARPYASPYDEAKT